MTVVGARGTVRIGGQYMDRLDEFALPGVVRPDMSNVAPPNDYGAYKGSASSHHHVYDNVVDVLLHGATVATPIEEGLAVVRVIARAHAWAGLDDASAGPTRATAWSTRSKSRETPT